MSATEQKHTTGPRRQTPGPWLSKEIAWQYDGSHALMWCDKSKGGEHWRRLDERCNGRFSAPDARLLAAAPDLLEAAKLVIAWYEAEDDHSKADFYQRMDMCRTSEAALRAAIAKATGATHE